METTTITIDWEEKKTAELLAAAKRSGYFMDCIDDAKAYQADGYCWVVALAMSCEFWCR